MTVAKKARTSALMISLRPAWAEEDVGYTPTVEVKPDDEVIHVEM